MDAPRAYAFHPGALADLDAIAANIGQGSAAGAARLVDEIRGAIEGLARFPLLGRRRASLTRRPLRFIVVRQYLIAYAPERQPLWVVAVIERRRNPRVISAILRGRDWLQ